MIIVIKKGSNQEDLKNSIAAMENSLKEFTQKTNKGFDAHKFCGVLKLNEDALIIQKRLRSEWD